MVSANSKNEPDEKVEAILERALIELEYISADAMLPGEGQPADTQPKGVALYFQAARNAVLLCIEIIEQARAKQNKVVAA